MEDSGDEDLKRMLSKLSEQAKRKAVSTVQSFLLQTTMIFQLKDAAQESIPKNALRPDTTINKVTVSDFLPDRPGTKYATSCGCLVKSET